jgi:DNA-binding FadR family transcriptional regulator
MADTDGMNVPNRSRRSGVDPAIGIADVLREEILQAGEGEFLGSEPQLIDRFGVSRPTMRQAMRILQSEGLLSVRRGVNGGLFAQPPTPATVAKALSVLLRHHHATHDHVVDALFALTAEVVRLAARNSDRDARRRVRDEIVGLEPSSDLDERTRILIAAVQFGELMADLAANPAVSLLVEVFLLVIPDQVASAEGVEGNYEASRAFHRSVAEAVAKGNASRAQDLVAAMRDQVHQWMS